MNKTISLNVTAGEAIENVQTLLQVKTGYSMKEWTLVFAGKELAAGYTLNDYGIQRDSTLHLSLKLKGGMRREALK